MIISSWLLTHQRGEWSPGLSSLIGYWNQNRYSMWFYARAWQISLPATHFWRYKRKQHIISTRTLILRRNLKLFIQHLLDVFKEYKPNMLDLNCALFVILSMHNGDTACKLFVTPCANIQKESRADTEEANGFPSNPISKWQYGMEIGRRPELQCA